jgi:hypothetical protein
MLGANIIAYCFAEKKGFSKFGSYTGNGSADGPFVYTGFKPAFVMFKRSNSAVNWYIFDNKRDSFNVMSKELNPNLSSAEGTELGANPIDFLSNGFKLRVADSYINATGDHTSTWLLQKTHLLLLLLYRLRLVNYDRFASHN